MGIAKIAGKILEVGEDLSLSFQHLNHYFQTRNWQAEAVALKGRGLHDLQEWLPFVQEGALMLRVPPEDSKVVLEHFPQLPTSVRWLEVADSLVFEDQEWWPRLWVYETLRRLVVDRFRDLDISLDSYVIGATPLGRAAVAAMAGLGFSRISLVDENERRLQAEVTLLRRYLFGVTIEAVPAQMLTLRDQPGSLMLNTMNLQDNSTVLGDLSYFNFMKSKGIVIDASACCPHNQLLEEAQRADLRTISGLVVQAYRDVDMLTKLFPQQYITYEDFIESFNDVFPSLKNPSSV